MTEFADFKNIQICLKCSVHFATTDKWPFRRKLMIYLSPPSESNCVWSRTVALPSYAERRVSTQASQVGAFLVGTGEGLAPAPPLSVDFNFYDGILPFYYFSSRTSNQPHVLPSPNICPSDN